MIIPIKMGERRGGGGGIIPLYYFEPCPPPLPHTRCTSFEGGRAETLKFHLNFRFLR